MEYTNLRDFGAICNKNGLKINKENIFDILIDEGIIEVNKAKKIYNLVSKFKCLTYFATENKLKNIPAYKVDGKAFVQMKKDFDNNIFLTPEGVKRILEHLKRKY